MFNLLNEQLEARLLVWIQGPRSTSRAPSRCQLQGAVGWAREGLSPRSTGGWDGTELSRAGRGVGSQIDPQSQEGNHVSATHSSHREDGPVCSWSLDDSEQSQQSNPLGPGQPIDKSIWGQPTDERVLSAVTQPNEAENIPNERGRTDSAARPREF